MKANQTTRWISWTCLAAVAGAFSLVAAENSASVQVERATVKEDQLVAVKDGKQFSPTNTVAMPFDILVQTNKTFTVGGGDPRPLKEGQVLKKDGTLLSPDGSLIPVVDHITQYRGEILVYRDGKASPLKEPLKLPDGGVVTPDGVYHTANGQFVRIQGGQRIMLKGKVFPATDTATINDGKVVVQKDGAQITLRPAQSIMMNDGTKIFGDGRVVKKDGTTTQLTEGETLELTGVRRRIGGELK